MYSKTDINNSIKFIKLFNAKEIFVAGNICSGKSTFAKELNKIIKYKNLDLDLWFKKYKKEYHHDANSVRNVFDFALKNTTKPYIANHTNLLTERLLTNSCLLIYLNPSKAQIIKNYTKRLKNKSQGDWLNNSIDKLAKLNAKYLNKYQQSIIYNNNKTGTIIYKMTIKTK